MEKKVNKIKKELDSKPLYNKIYLKTKTKSYNGKTNTSFHNNKTAKKGSQLIFLLLILIDSIFRKDKSYYSLVFWKRM